MTAKSLPIFFPFLLILLLGCERGGWVTDYTSERIYPDLEGNHIYQIAKRTEGYYYKSVGSCSGGSRDMKYTYYLIDYAIVEGKPVDARVVRLVQSEFEVGNIDTFVKSYCRKHLPVIDYANIFAYRLGEYTPVRPLPDSNSQKNRELLWRSGRHFVADFGRWLVFANNNDVDWISDTLYFYRNSPVPVIEHKVAIDSNLAILNIASSNDTNFIILRDRPVNAIYVHYLEMEAGQPHLSKPVRVTNTSLIPHTYKIDKIVERWVKDRYRYNVKTGQLLWLNEVDNPNSLRVISSGFDSIAYLNNGKLNFYQIDQERLMREFDKLK